MSRGWSLFVVVITVLVFTGANWRSKVMDSGHNAMVRATGIVPHQIGSAEGVGRSTVSYADAVRNACYWGKKTPVSIQYSKTGNWFNAVVRYR